jgi:hypothetical protein
MRSKSKALLIGLAIATVAGTASPSHAQDFFARLFGGITRQAPRPTAPAMSPFGYGSEMDERASRPQVSYGGGTAYCVRTCDGRYFPVPASDRASRAASCNSFCPSAETQVFHGSNIDDAVSEKGKAYTSLANAFRYRNEMVAGCTCNGKDGGGLAQVKIDDDPTLRSGDIVAGENGLMVARRSDRRGASVSLSPAAQSLQSKYQRPRILAKD